MPAARHRLLATIALVMGGFGIGTTEFVTMGLLPNIADGLGVTIPQAGHSISAYALGVVVGAPVLAILGAKWPRKAMLVGLMVAVALANAASALAPDFGWLLVARFLAGMPHGAFFGAAALVAVDLAPPGQAGRAVGRVMIGIPVANVVGVPGATWLGQQFGWRAAYWLVAAVAVVTVMLLIAFIPHIARDLESTIRRELSDFLSVQVALTLLVGAIGFGGMFSMFSYVAPTLTEVTGVGRRGPGIPACLWSWRHRGRATCGAARGVVGAARHSDRVCGDGCGLGGVCVGSAVAGRGSGVSVCVIADGIGLSGHTATAVDAGRGAGSDFGGGKQPLGTQHGECVGGVAWWARHRGRVGLHRAVVGGCRVVVGGCGGARRERQASPCVSRCHHFEADGAGRLIEATVVGEHG